jgi:hypothetical protein
MVVLASSAASAQPSTAVKVPTQTVPCAKYGSLELHAIGEDPVLCWEAGCMQLDLHKGSASLVDKPKAASAWLGPIAEVNADSVCVGTSCKKLGKHLVAALAAVREQPVKPAILATADLKSVVVGSTAWNVDTDRRIKLVAPHGMKPPLGKNTYKPAEVNRIDVAGDLLLVHWSNCVDDQFCIRVQLTEGAGRAIGAHREGGGLAPIQLDEQTSFAVVGDRGSVQFFDMKSRKLTGAVELAARPTAAVRIGAHDIALLYETFADPHTLHVAMIGLSVEAQVWRSMTLPRCIQ